MYEVVSVLHVPRNSLKKSFLSSSLSGMRRNYNSLLHGSFKKPKTRGIIRNLNFQKTKKCFWHKNRFSLKTTAVVPSRLKLYLIFILQHSDPNYPLFSQLSSDDCSRFLIIFRLIPQI